MFDLMLMRHAKSDWHSHTADIDRPLNNRGIRDAVAMGRYLQQQEIVPDKIVASSAERTRQTASLLITNLPLSEKDIIVDNDLYLADTETLLESIEVYAADKHRLLILAHNPGMDYLVSYLANRPPALSSNGKLMSTCAVACFGIDAVESLQKPGQCVLQKLIRPKEIPVA